MRLKNNAYTAFHGFPWGALPNKPSIASIALSPV